MANNGTSLEQRIQAYRKRWLVTGAAGFIGSNLVEWLLNNGQPVTGLDNFVTGRRANIEGLQQVAAVNGVPFNFVEADMLDLDACQEACAGVDYVLHQAALGSVPRSIKDPLATHHANVTGLLHLLIAARDANIQRFVFASSSSVYGDSQVLPKVEQHVGSPLSPYAVTKRVDEMYAAVFESTYGLPTIGLRYFNVFGPRQDPGGPYAAVIPKWIEALLNGELCYVNGDGETTRDFCYVENVIHANIRAAITAGDRVTGQVYNIAGGQQISLNRLFVLLTQNLRALGVHISHPQPEYCDFRAGDVRHSFADTTKAAKHLGYASSVAVEPGIARVVKWYVDARAKEENG